MTEQIPSDERKIKELEAIARKVREDLIEMFWRSGGGHIGGSLSAVDIIVALYFHILRVDPKNPKWPSRDRFVLSKGHASATWYAVLAERGFFSKSLLFTDFIKVDGILQEHSEMTKIPGVEMSSGSLGQGLSVGLGMALAGKLKGEEYRVYVMLGDGEIQSGQVWEAAMASAHYKAGNLTAILDYNKLQVDGTVADQMNIEPILHKFEAFGWCTKEINGHDMRAIVRALEEVKREKLLMPTIIVAHTVKGKGIPFMENNVKWHSNALTEEEYQQAKQAL